MRVRIGAASCPAAGERVCGDAYVVVPLAEGTLVCLADGLGHGPDARSAAEEVCRYARAHAGESLPALLRGMDGALAGSRGAAVSVLTILPAARRVLFVGIGNVELRARSRARIAPPTSAGIVGHRTGVVRVWEYPVADGDLLVLMSDGVSGRFELEAFAHLEPQALAEAIVAKQHKLHDDACCVAMKIGEVKEPGDAPPTSARG